MTYYRIDLTGGGQEVILADQKWSVNAAGVLSVWALGREKDEKPSRMYSPAGWRKVQGAHE